MLQNNQNKNLLLIKDLGMKFPKETSKNKVRYGLYKCHCSNEFEAIIQNVKMGKAKSCGCLKKGPEKIHFNINKKLYQIWVGMKNRCNNVKNKDYKNYGGRGITVCDEWMDNVLLFNNWALANGYDEGLTLDREDNNGNYSPFNCRWTTRSVQNKNRRKWTIK